MRAKLEVEMTRDRIAGAVRMEQSNLLTPYMMGRDSAQIWRQTRRSWEESPRPQLLLECACTRYAGRHNWIGLIRICHVGDENVS